MAGNQGWMRPANARKIHYVLNERTLCNRWSVTNWFWRLNLGLGGVITRRRRLCYDCRRRHAQLIRNFQLPVEPPEPRPPEG